MSSNLALPTFVVSLCLAFVWCGSAAAGTEPIRIEYDAARGCPTEREFQRRVFERTASARLAGPGEAARVFKVVLQRSGKKVSGSLVIREPDGNTVARRLSGDNCAEVALVLALASALAIDPRAELAPHERLEDTSDDPETSGTSDELPPTSGNDARRDTSSSGQPNDEAQTDDSPWPTTSWGPARRWRAGLGVGPRLAYGMAPRAAWGGSALVFAESHELLVGLELGYAKTRSPNVNDASAQFELMSARPQLCPSAFNLGQLLQLRPCGVIEVGLLTASGQDLAVDLTQRRFWSAAELMLRLDATLSGHWFVGLEAALVLPLTRYQFVFEKPETTVHPIPSVGGAAAARAGFRF